jgi:poly(3-hydroxybutyrate) depolymerase
LQRTHALPLIVVAHGRNGSPRQLDSLLDAWAGAGYVVASPRLPRVALDRHGRPSPADAEQFAGDLDFVITKMEELSASSTANPVRGLVDPAHVGVAGISLGGQAVYALISHTCCRDPRVSAAVLLSAVRRPLPNGVYEPQSAAVLLVHGRADVGYHHSVSTYPQLAAPKWFVTLRKGTHGPPFEDEDDPHDALVQEVTTAFWDLSLADDQAGAHRIEHAVATSHGGATLERRLR